MSCPQALREGSGQMGAVWLVGWALTDAEPLESNLDASSRGKAVVGVGLFVGPAHWRIDLDARPHCGTPAQRQVASFALRV
jgi:hypothetical protein